MKNLSLTLNDAMGCDAKHCKSDGDGTMDEPTQDKEWQRKKMRTKNKLISKLKKKKTLKTSTTTISIYICLWSGDLVVAYLLILLSIVTSNLCYSQKMHVQKKKLNMKTAP